MKDKKWMLSLTLGLVLVAALGFWGYRQADARRTMEAALNNKYQRAFYDLTTHVQNMEVLLSKTLVGQETRQDTFLLMNLWQEADAAQKELGQIPVPDGLMTRTMKYLTQVGDYANTLAKQTIDGKPKTDEQWRTLRYLYSQSSGLNEELHNIESHVADGRLTLSELTTQTRKGLRKEGPQLANNNLQTLDKKMQQFPTLIYDGPFSDHLADKKPLGITGDSINADQARSKALGFIDRRGNKDYVANVVHTQKGRTPSYQVDITSCPVRENERITAAISRQGGNVLWMLNSRAIGDKKVSLESAGDRAAKFLAGKGFKNMQSTYHEVQDRLAIYNFAATQGGVVLYPDLVKVSVALDTGQVVGFEASNYWDSHRDRKISAPRLTLAQARKKLSPHLEGVSGGRLALIPLSPDTETLTYEFKGNLGKDVFLVYINADNGREERLLRVVDTEEGVLTV
ncbi:spore germination protein YpeB [Desulfocucumis palustris]|uniref:Spore germination protein YpeB n=1 Tax=Desulfocucumis palustris TaxID=1898651 RepID=A0A2L2XI82_9FIRM|nr:germination protein YpeB [Desulfocucumis palustris]GBF35684.1 spore germination protein YpeB [Desulfocucumis palustris]